eukprot:TRINITY_DN1114_c0_g1_i1.p1 TRINITY_DN1114_c0_g1~~TRINITY_DN1114_c0_g1_i1.p1  ORF type:complete len:138 (-),score=19.42 TRINITY_DN1114_c0_g1_i1:337-750(-)
MEPLTGQIFAKEDLVLHYGDEEEVYVSMVDLFIENSFNMAGSQMELLFKSYKDRNAPELKRFAHSLKSSFKAVGLQLVGDACEHIQNAADKSNFDAAKLYLEKLLELLPTSLEQITLFIKSKPSDVKFDAKALKALL